MKVVALVFFILFVDSLIIGSDDEGIHTEIHEHVSKNMEFEDYSDPTEIVNVQTIKDIPGLTDNMVIETINEARKEILEEEEKTMRPDEHDGEYETLQKAHFKGFAPELEPVRIGAMVKEKTIKLLAQKLGMNDKEKIRIFEGLESGILSEMCLMRATDASPVPFGYRTIDGSENNLIFPDRGRTNTRFSRILRPDYGDGISSPRKAANGEPLHNARNISAVVFNDTNLPSANLSHMSMIWGQFLGHDITLSPESPINCTNKCGLYGECFGIPVLKYDSPFRGKSCIQLRRSIPFCQPNRHQREQINRLSSFIDASVVYSSDSTRFITLRDPSDTALLLEQNHPTDHRLNNLLSPDEQAFCRNEERNLKCFKSGDARTNENPGLASMHTIWHREHNRIVKELRSINPHWRMEKLFFEARKIVGALVQHITYNEYLPLILSKAIRLKHDLVLQQNDFYNGYRVWMNPSLFNSFSAAAYRFGHSMVPNAFNRFGKTYRTITPSIPMNRFFDTSFLYQSQKDGVDSILRGLAEDRSQNVDGFFSKAVQEELVRGPGDLADLPALNIQRGRDHGIPGYNQFRKVAGLKKLTSFADLRDVMTPNQIRKLQKVYKHVNDIDLFVGGVLENHVKGGSLGPTFSKIIAMQFRRLRRGDRFWYENKDEFSTAQLQEIRNGSLARVICDNSDGIEEIQERVLEVSRYSRTKCSDLPKVNLMMWKKMSV